MRLSALFALIVLLFAPTAYAQNMFTADVRMCSGRPWIDVTCNGADPTGAADSTTAISNTISTAVSNDWPVFFPAGTYKVTSKITVEYGGQAANGPQIISQAAFIDGRSITSGNVLAIQCTGGTTASPVICNHFGIQGWLTIMGSGAGYVVTIGKTDFSDQQNGVRIEHLVVTNAGSGGAIQANYLTDGDLWLSGSTQGGSSSIGAVALEQVQTSKIGGYGLALGASAPGLLLENGASVNNAFVGFGYDPNDAICISITSAAASRNAWMAPHLPCVTAVNAPSNPTQNMLIGPNFAGPNGGATSPGMGVIGRGSLYRFAAPTAASKTVFGVEDGTLFSAANATGAPTGFTSASLAITLPNPTQVGSGYTVGFVSDNNKAVVVSTAGGNILLAGQTFSQLVVGAPNTINFEVAILVSDGTNFRVEHLSQGSALYNGAQTALPAHWEFPGGPGYVATQGDNGMVVSSSQAAGTLSVTLPQISQVQPGYMIGLAIGSHHPIALNLNGTNGGAMYLADGSSPIGTTFYRNQSVQIFQFDGSAFRQITGAPLGDVRDFDADMTGVADSSTAVQNAVNATCASAGGNVNLPAGTIKFHDITVNCDGVHIRGQGPGGLITPTWATTAGKGTTVDCGAISNTCIKVVPSGSPGVVNRLRGNSVEGLTFINVSQGRALEFDQVESGSVRNVAMTGAAGGIKIYGALNFDLDNIVQWNTSGLAYEISGDTAGKAGNGGACVIGNCSTRTDFVTIHHLYGSLTATGTLMSIHEGAFTIVGDHIAMEGGATGLLVRCVPGQLNLNFCPQQIILTDFENEFSGAPFDIQDATWIKLIAPFGAGVSASPGVSPNTNHILTYTLVNYPISTGTGGGLTIIGAQFFGAVGSCVWSGIDSVTVVDSDIYGCNGGNVGGAGIEFTGGGVQSGGVGIVTSIVANNRFTSSVNAAPLPMTGVLIDQGASQITITGNSCLNTTNCVVNNSLNPASVYALNNNPPPPFGSLSTPAGCGSGCVVTTSTGNQLGGSLLMTAGSGAASSGSFSMFMSQPLYPEALCFFTLHNGGSGTWQPGATAQVETPTPNAVAVNWDNNGVALGNGASYFIDYRCSGF